jgi:hypothetical protein
MVADDGESLPERATKADGVADGVAVDAGLRVQGRGGSDGSARMTDGMKVSDWPMPTMEQARFYAAGVEAGIAGAVVLQALIADAPVERLAALAERWERTREVRAARFDVRAWLEKDTPSKIEFALQRSRSQMAAYLATTNLAEAKDAHLAKALKFIEVLEKVVAGTAGKQDAAAQFFQQFLKNNQKAKKDAEAVN